MLRCKQEMDITMRVIVLMQNLYQTINPQETTMACMEMEVVSETALIVVTLPTHKAIEMPQTKEIIMVAKMKQTFPKDQMQHQDLEGINTITVLIPMIIQLAAVVLICHRQAEI